MRIGIDARMYGPKQAGLGRYIQQLILHLEEIDTKDEYVIFLCKDNWDEFKTSKSNFKKVLANIPWYSLNEQLFLKKIILKEKVDLMHFPHWNVPIFYNQPFVVTIHDLIMYFYPRPGASTHNRLWYWFKDKVHRQVIKHAVKKSKRIIAVSNFTKQDIHKALKIPLEKITVIYQCPFFSEIYDSNNGNQILEKFKINKPYVLYVGNAYPHKNLEGLLEAWKIFQEKYGDGFQLVLCGKKNYFYKRLITYFSAIKSVVFTDFVSDEELAKLYQNASLYVFPSLYEGFGLPPFEAIKHNVPVVSSNASCLPEILGEGAMYFDPNNFEQMSEIIYKGLTDQNIRQELLEKGKNELGKFNCKKMTENTIGVYYYTGRNL